MIDHDFIRQLSERVVEIESQREEEGQALYELQQEVEILSGQKQASLQDYELRIASLEVAASLQPDRVLVFAEKVFQWLKGNSIYTDNLTRH